MNAHFKVTGDVTGNQWVINDTARRKGTSFAPDSCGFSAEITGIQRIISRGALQNDFARYSYRMNTDPETCAVTFTEPVFSIECRGR